MKKAEDALPNELLSYEREHRQLTQEELAEQIGVPDYNMIGRWERGITLPSAHHRQQLTTLFGKSARELGLVRKGEIPFWRVPYRQNMFFTGRAALLTQVHTSLVAHRHARLIPPQTFSGLGGVGKTQAALEYAYRYGHEYHTVIWMRASSRETLTSDYAAITELLNLPEQHEQDQRQMIRAVNAWLAAMTRWLLIFDNVEDLDLLDDFLPSPVRGHILLTTRTRMTGTMAETLEIETMDLEEGSYFLLRRAKLLALSASLDDIAEAERNQARAIVEMVGGLPLALDQVGAYIEETGCTLANYSERYHAHRPELLRWRGVMGTGHPESVVTTLSLSFEQLSHANQVARDLLSFCALLAPDTIPEELLMEGMQEFASPLLARSTDPVQFDQVMKDLRKFSLMRHRPETNMLTIHRLVQAVLLDAMEQETQYLWAERIVRTLSRMFPHKYIGTWQQCERLLAQANSCAELIEEWNITTPEAALLLLHLAAYLQDRCRLTQVERLYQRALAIAEQAHGAEHREVAQYLYKLGSFYLKLGKYSQSKTFHQRALQIQEQTLETNYARIALNLQNLGTISYHMGNYAQAEAFFQQCFHIYRSLDPQPPELAEILNDLAAVYRKQGNYAQAEPLHLQALQLHEQLLGPEHGNMGGHLFNLASCYFEQGKYAQAESTYHQALNVWKRTIGEEDFDYAYGLRGLANLYQAQGLYTQAEPLYQQALAIFEATLGPENINVARVLLGMAHLSTGQGDYRQAETRYQRALPILEASLGPDHLDVAKAFDDLANLYAAQHNTIQAERFSRQALAIYQKVQE